MRNNYSGDSLVYLSFAKNVFGGNGFGINAHEFSSGATSPLWALLLTPAFLFSHPEIIAQILGVVFLLAGLWIGRKMMPDNYLRDILIAVIFYFAIIPSIQFFETGLMILVLFLMIKHKWAYAILPFVRPEGIFISLFVILKRKQWIYLLSLLPIVIWWLYCIHITGYFSTSAVFRSGWLEDNLANSSYMLKRYMLILFPFAAYFIVTRFEKYKGLFDL